MAKTFPIEIMTPERMFFKGDIEALTVVLPDGEMTVLADHAPMVAVLDISEIHLLKDGVWRYAFTSEGFVEVLPGRVQVFTQACEWPEEIDRHRAEMALERANERLRQQQSILEHKSTQIAIARAMMRLRVSGSRATHKYQE